MKSQMETELRGLMNQIVREHCECCAKLADEVIATHEPKEWPRTTPGFYRSLILATIHATAERVQVILCPENYEASKRQILQSISVMPPLGGTDA